MFIWFGALVSASCVTCQIFVYLLMEFLSQVYSKWLTRHSRLSSAPSFGNSCEVDLRIERGSKIARASKAIAFGRGVANKLPAARRRKPRRSKRLHGTDEKSGAFSFTL